MGKVTLKCEYCDSDFEVYPYRADSASFCSCKCSGKWTKENGVHKSPKGKPPNAVDKKHLNCKFCEKVFEPKRGKQKFCSLECYYNYKSGEWTNGENPNPKIPRITEICETCGKKFERLECYGKGRFCSRECYHKSRKGSVPHNKGKTYHKTCEYCGKDFEAQKKTRKFCEKDCYMESLRKDKVSVSCANCDKKFLVYPCREKNFVHNFCTDDCYKEWFISGQGENNPNWKGGKSFETYGREFNNKLREKIRKRDNYECCLCGKTEDDSPRRLSVHHIDYDKKNNSEENLITLCRGCHTKTNSHRETFKRIFYTFKQLDSVMV